MGSGSGDDDVSASTEEASPAENDLFSYYSDYSYYSADDGNYDVGESKDDSSAYLNVKPPSQYGVRGRFFLRCDWWPCCARVRVCGSHDWIAHHDHARTGLAAAVTLVRPPFYPMAIRAFSLTSTPTWWARSVHVRSLCVRVCACARACLRVCAHVCAHVCGRVM